MGKSRRLEPCVFLIIAVLFFLLLSIVGSIKFGFHSKLHLVKVAIAVLMSLTTFCIYSSRDFSFIGKYLVFPLLILGVFVLYSVEKTYSIVPPILLFLLHRYHGRANFSDGRVTQFLSHLSLLIGVSVPPIFSIVRGIPVLDWNLRLSTSTSPIRMVSLMLILLGLYYFSVRGERKKEIVWTLVAATSTSLFGFRLEPLVLLMALVIDLYLSGEDLRNISILCLLIPLPIVLIGYSVISHSPQEWNIGVLGLPIYRSAHTLWVFSESIGVSWPYGSTMGKAIFSMPRAREVVSEVVFGQEGISLTSTIFGPPMLDFGVPGLFSFFAILGILSSVAKSRSKLDRYPYSVFLSFLAVGVETGIEGSMLTILVTLSYVSWRVRDEEV